MAKVLSPTKFSGTIDDMTFRQTEDGNIAGSKPGPTREKVLRSDNFRRTRRNAGEFKLAVHDGTLLRHALAGALQGMASSSLNGRMNGLFISIARQDRVCDLGSRRACNGDVGLLNGFDFNKRLPLSEVWGLKFTHSLDAASGVFKAELPSFIARKRKIFPAEATHFRIVSGGVAVNFICPHFKGNTQDIRTSVLLPLGKKTPGAIGFEHQVKVREGEVLVQVLGIGFYKLVNGREVLVKGGALRVLEAVKTGCEVKQGAGLVREGINRLVCEDTNQGGSEGKRGNVEVAALQMEDGLVGAAGGWYNIAGYATGQVYGPSGAAAIRRKRCTNAGHNYRYGKFIIKTFFMEHTGKFTLITGATSGIGYELAKLFAADQFNLVIVARSADDLSRTASELGQHGIQVVSIATDLFEPDSGFQLYDDVKARGIDIDILVNDAGQGVYGEFADTDIHRELAIIQLNISSLVVLTKLFLKDMLQRGEGRILNLSSIASKAPGPYQSVYHGTKAFVQSFSEAIHNEVKDKGVVVTALLPGATDTDFFNKADMNESKIVQEGKLDDPAKVAKDGYEALMKGKDMVVSGFKNKMNVAMSNLMSDEAAADNMRKKQEPVDHRDSGKR